MPDSIKCFPPLAMLQAVPLASFAVAQVDQDQLESE